MAVGLAVWVVLKAVVAKALVRCKRGGWVGTEGGRGKGTGEGHGGRGG